MGASAFHFKKYLVMGSRGLEVVELQKILARGMYLSVEPTGYFGALTRKATMAYQKAHGIAQTGTVGPITRASLNAWTDESL